MDHQTSGPSNNHKHNHHNGNKKKKKHYYGKKKFNGFFNGRKQSQKVKSLQSQTSHGFQEFENLQQLNEFFREDPADHPRNLFEPVIGPRARPTARDRAVSRGDR